MLSTDYYSVSIDHISVGNDQDGNDGAVTVIRLNNLVPMKVEVLNARQLLQELDKEKLLSAIEIGMEMQSNKSGIELKLHEETGMLFVKGTEIETALVTNIVDQLNVAMARESGKFGLGGRGGGGGAGFGGGWSSGGSRSGIQSAGPGRGGPGSGGAGRGGPDSGGAGRGGPPSNRGGGAGGLSGGRSGVNKEDKKR